MEWLEITVNAPHGELEPLSADLEELGVSGIVTEGQRDVEDFLENNKTFWDYVGEEVFDAVRGLSRLKFYLESSEEGRRELAGIRAALPGRTFEEKTVRDEDWENNWKAYYKPLEAGRLMIVPEWEETPETDRRILRLDPGLIFGTGSHATTRLCLEALGELPLEGASVLDLGCGSGILAIAALLLDAKDAVGVDIDEKAPPVVMANAALNGIGGDRLTVFAGDVLADGDFARKIAERKFRVVLANIVADVIIALAPRVGDFMEPDGVFVCSGIIDGRQDEVRAALEENGFSVASAREKDGWHAFICRIGDGVNG